MKTIAPKILAAPNQHSLAICLVASQQTYFQLRAVFLSLAPSSAKGYYATVYFANEIDVSS